MELGCGSARHAVELVRTGLAVTGIDRSADMIARRMIGAKPPWHVRAPESLIQGDATTIRRPPIMTLSFLYSMW